MDPLLPSSLTLSESVSCPAAPTMDPLCDFCGAQRALVYCKADDARLCLPCDGFVHSANTIARRHLRAPLCDRCLSRPASVRCSATNASLCQSCDHGGAGQQQQQPLYGYSGCPSLPELSRVWACGGVPQGPSAMATINENCAGSSWDSVSGSEAFGRLGPRMGPTSSLIPQVGPIMHCSGEESMVFFNNQPKVKIGCPPLEELAICDDEHYEGSNAGIGGFSIGNNGTFTCPQTYPRNQFQDEGMDGLFFENNFSVADSNGHVENVIEDMNGNADQVTSYHNIGNNVGHNFHIGNVYPNISISLSNQTGESSATAYQDCGISPMFLTGDSPCDSNMETSHPQARKEAKMRYNEKKRSRLFGKNIKYASRKARADTRKRVKGRFVKAGEGCDYDPLKLHS